MKCKNCGTENPDDVNSCDKCGKPPEEGKIRIYYPQIAIGSVIGLLLISLINYLWGVESVLLSGLLSAVIISGCVTTVISYNKNFKVGYDYNPLIQGMIVAFIVSILTMIMIISQDPSRGALFIFVPGLIFWGFLGSCIGIIINFIREKDIRLIIPLAIVIILIATAIGYISNSNHISSEFDTATDNQITGLAFSDLIQVEADFYLNKTFNNSTERDFNLKEAQKRYQRIIEITTYDLEWNMVMQENSGSTVATEYAQALKLYLDLKLEYFNQTEAAIELELKGDTKRAKIEYQEAQKLIPLINKQKILLTTIAKKDPEFQKYIEKNILQSEKFAQYYKDKNELLIFQFDPPS